MYRMQNDRIKKTFMNSNFKEKIKLGTQENMDPDHREGSSKQ